MQAIDFAERAQEYISAWSTHDLERILAPYADDVELWSPLVGTLTGQSEATVRGKAALRDYFARGLAAYPDLRFDFIRLHSGVRSCVVEYRSVNDRLSAELMEFEEHSKVHRVLAHYCDQASETIHLPGVRRS